MALVFPNVAVLGLSQDSRFFDAGFQYASFRKLTIAGTVNDLTETFGITGVWSGQQGVINTIRNNRDYQSLTLNGVDFGSGRIDDISFEPGLDVQLKGYTANITVFDSGNLFNFTGQYYSGIDTSQFRYLQQFNEDYSFDRKVNGGYSYSHNATIQLTSGVGQLNSIQAAQNIARTLFTGSNLGFAFYPQFTNVQGKRFVTETYDLINNVCGFQETFDFDNYLTTYSATQTVSVELSAEGIVTATENGQLRGIQNPNYQYALNAVNIEMTGSYYRCSGAVNYYFPTGALLVASPTSQGRQIDIFNNNINYSVVFDNAPSNLRTYFWDYTLQASKQDGVSTVTENGTVVGRGVNPTESFVNAQSGFAIVKAGIPARTTALFVAPYNPATNYLESKQESYSPVQGQCGYGYQYSNDPTLISDVGVRREEVSINDDSPNYTFNKINIFNVAEIAQNAYQNSQGSRTTSVHMEGDKITSLQGYLNTAIATINSNIPIGNDRYIGAVSYSFDPNNGSCDVQLTWLYNEVAIQTYIPS